MYKLGATQEKVLLVLLGGLVLGASKSSIQYYKRFYLLLKEWKMIDQRSFSRSIKKLSDCKLVTEHKCANGSFKLVLTERGKKQAKVLNLFGESIKFKKSKSWDKKWRIVIFDISQIKKTYREAFRGKIKELDFYCLQKSVWVYPYDCESEIELLKDFFGLSEDELRLIVAKKIGNDAKLKGIFALGS